MRILAATDFSPASEHAVRRAAWLARDLGAALALAHVIPAELFQMIETYWYEVTAPPQAEDSLSGLCERIRAETGVTASPHIPAGKIVRELSLLAQRLDADLVVVGAKGEHALRDMLFGSTASRLLRACPRALLVVRRAPEGPYQRPMVGMDFREAACRALRTVHTLAPQARIRAVHAFAPPLQSLLLRAGISQERLDAAVREAGEEARRRLEAALDACTVAHEEVIPEALHGYPPEVLYKCSVETGADLLAVGRNEAPAPDNAWLGSVSKHAVYESGCDVLVVPPARKRPEPSESAL